MGPKMHTLGTPAAACQHWETAGGCGGRFPRVGQEKRSRLSGGGFGGYRRINSARAHVCRNPPSERSTFLHRIFMPSACRGRTGTLKGRTGIDVFAGR